MVVALYNIKRHGSISRKFTGAKFTRVARDGPCIFTPDQNLRRDYQISITVERIELIISSIERISKLYNKSMLIFTVHAVHAACEKNYYNVKCKNQKIVLRDVLFQFLDVRCASVID